MATSPGSDLKSDRIACGDVCSFPTAMVGSPIGVIPIAAAVPAASVRNSRLERNIGLPLSTFARLDRVTQFQSLTLGSFAETAYVQAKPTPRVRDRRNFADNSKAAAIPPKTA